MKHQIWDDSKHQWRLGKLPVRQNQQVRKVSLFFLIGLIYMAYAWTAPTLAQADAPIFEEFFFFGSADASESVAVGDLNGDGALDLVIGNWYEPPFYTQHNLIYLNDGQGNFGDGIPFGNADDLTLSVVLGDLNGDGALDLVVGNRDRQNAVYLNDGQGNFGNGVYFGDADFTTSVVLGDLNGDGTLDLVVGNWDEKNVVYLNDGQGNFDADTRFSSADATDSIALGDLNGDGTLDLVVGNRAQQNEVYFNDGQGKFDTRFLFDITDNTRSVALGDLNGDGALDLFVGNRDREDLTEYDIIYLNDGQGNFDSGIPFDSEDRTESVAIGDLNGDGVLDLLVATWREGYLAYFNDGQGNFSEGIPFGNAEATVGIALGDLNGDGTLDLVSANWKQQNTVYLNKGFPFGLGHPFDVVDNTNSVVLGDLNGDGSLDLVVGNSARLGSAGLDLTQRTLIYFSDDQIGFGTPIAFSQAYTTTSIALGDLNNDGSLDLVLGNWTDDQSVVFLNDGQGNFSSGTPFGSVCNSEATLSIALGDLDSDGDLDLVVGTGGQANVVYRNDGQGNFDSGECFSITDTSTSLALGDLNGDGSLDLVVGNWLEQNLVYFNDGQGNFGAAVPFGGVDGTEAIALGDLNGDGALDIVVGNRWEQSLIYLNDGQGNFATAIPFGVPEFTRALALGDINGDGALDIALGTRDLENLIFLNDGQGNFGAGLRFSDVEDTISLALGDLNGDGSLDLVTGNSIQYDDQSNRVYLNGRWFGHRGTTNDPLSLTVARPLTTGNANFYSSPVVLTERYIPIPYTLFDPEGERVGRLDAFYSLDGGGNWQPAIATPDTVTTNLKTGHSIQAKQVYSPTGAIPDGSGALELPLTLTVTDTIADLEVSLSITHTQTADLQVVLVSPQGTQVSLLNGIPGQGFLGTLLDDQAATSIISGTTPYRGRYQPQENLNAFKGQSINGTWRLVITDTVVGEAGSVIAWGLRISTPPEAHVYTWDTFASGVFGQSDNVVLRLVAYPQPIYSGVPNTFRYANRTAGPYQWPYASATTFPFRVQGTQVQVRQQSMTELQPVSNALVYRLPQGEDTGAEAIANTLNGQPFRTDHNGYLQGRGRLEIGDQLIALLPISATQNYTIYQTSAAPTASGLDLHTVTEPGVQTLTISEENTLILFNLVVSLEWDARQMGAENTFLDQLKSDIQRASAILYDATNGQAALGDIHIYHDKGFWGHANVIVQANNSLRPSAVLGGIVLTPTNELSSTEVITGAYIPGQIRMPPEWNRWGEPDGTLGDDWPRVFAHELGHYLFFVVDNYLGLTEDAHLSLVDCSGSMMSDPYLYDEFLTSDQWKGDEECQKTLAERYLKRSDWETIKVFYPMLKASANEGPNQLPLAVTQMQTFAPTTPTNTLDVPFFRLVDKDGNPAPVPLGQAQAYLIKTRNNSDPTDDYIIDQGTPIGDQMHARGAALGDRLCVIDYSQTVLRVGCLDNISTTATSITLNVLPDWAPQVRISPVSTNTVTVSVTNVTENMMQAQLLPALGAASTEVPMLAIGSGFTQTLTAPNGAYYGFVRLWVPGSMPRKELIVDFTVLEDWRGQGYTWGGQGYTWGSPSNGWGGQGYTWGGQGYTWGGQGYTWGAPLMSSDGQVSVFPLDNLFGNNRNFTLQKLVLPPAFPTWLTLVGQAYRFDVEGDIPNGDILFRYLARNVPEDQESRLRIYYSPDEGVTWERLDNTLLDARRNHASARLHGAGIYGLVSTIAVPSFEADTWNTFGYPVEETRLITDALASIEGSYTSVYHYDPSLPNPWLLYDVTVLPPFTSTVNTLHTLEHSKSYWLYATEAITLFLGVDSDPTSTNLKQSAALQLPPATFYGWITPTIGFTPTVGLPVTAVIDGVICGQTTVKSLNGRFVYTLQVAAENAKDTPNGCGTPGRAIEFRVGDWIMNHNQPWSNSQAWYHPLDSVQPPPPSKVYLPIIRK